MADKKDIAIQRLATLGFEFNADKNDLNEACLLKVSFRGGTSRLEKPSAQSIVETEEYLEMPFRILSEVNVESHSLDLTRKGVLKSAKALFKTRVLKDHNSSIDSIIGSVESVKWSESNGDTPAGVDGVIRVYKKLSGSVVEKLKLSLIDSVSAGIIFSYEKSHPEMDFWEFLFSLGETVDGEVVRFIVTEILDVIEVSLVYRGADPYAIRLSNIFFENKVSEKVDLKTEEILGGDMKLNKAQAIVLNLSDSEISKLGLDKSESVDIDQTYFDLLVGKLSVVEREKKDLERKIVEQEKFAQLGRKHEELVRAEALKNYRALRLEEQDEKIVELLEKSDLSFVESLNSEYKKELAKKHPLVEGSRQSSEDSDLAEKVKEDVEEYKVGV
jgi:hypothetical protein